MRLEANARECARAPERVRSCAGLNRLRLELADMVILSCHLSI